MKKSLLVGIVLTAAMLAAIVAPVSAQEPPARPERPYRGLFGGGVGNTEQLLTLSVSAGAGYDGHILTREGAQDSRRRRGSFGYSSASLSYSLSRSRVSFGASANASGAYYPVLQKPFASREGGGVGVTLELSPSSHLTANQDISYEPYYALGTFPTLFEPSLGHPTVIDESQEARAEHRITSGTSVAFSQTLSRRVTFSANYTLRRTRTASHDLDFSHELAGGRFGIAIARGLSARLGYGYGEARYGTGEDATRTQGHTIDAGLDFNRTLSFSRRVTFGFGSGVTAVSDANQTQYRAVGFARLNREIGRTWNAALAYSRNVEYLEIYRAPVFGDSVSIAAGGLLSRRATFQSMVGIAFGDVGFGEAARGFQTYYGNVGLRYGVTRNLAIGTMYSYLRYSFQSGVELPLGLTREGDRQSVRVYLTLWQPIIQKNRRASASR